MRIAIAGLCILILIADVIDHYVQTELSPNADWHSHATRIAYRYFMKKWIQPLSWSCDPNPIRNSLRCFAPVTLVQTTLLSLATSAQDP